VGLLAVVVPVLLLAAILLSPLAAETSELIIYLGLVWVPILIPLFLTLIWRMNRRERAQLAENTEEGGYR
jgi:hypothetical protein